MGCIRNSRDNQKQKQDQFSHGQIQGEKAKKSNPAVRRTQQLASNSSPIALTRQTGGVAARIVLTLLVLAAAGFAVKLYLVQELIAGLLLVAIAVMTVLVLSVGFVLFQEGIRRALLWRKSRVAPISSFVPHENGY